MREADRVVHLGHIAHQGEQEDPREDGGQSQGFRGWLDRAGHDFAHHCKTERHQHQQTDRLVAGHRSLRFLDLVARVPFSLSSALTASLPTVALLVNSV